MKCEQENRRNQRRAGYQLIELMVVMIIIGIVLAAAVPNLTRRNSYNRIEGSARALSNRMQTARQMAVNRRVPFRMLLDADAGTYSFERQLNDSTWTADPDEVYQLEGVSQTLSEIGGSSTADEIVFHPRGTVRDTDVPAEIRLINSAEDTASVRLVVTGRVTVHVHPAAS